MKIDKHASPICLLSVVSFLAGCAQGSAGPSTWPPIDSGSDPGYDTGYDTGLDTLYDPGLDTGVDPGTDPGTDPGVDPGTDPGCTETPCGLLPNCGCAAGEKCYVNMSLTPPARGCTTAGTGDSSMLCTSEASCAPGTQCLTLIGDSTSPESMCFDYCNSETDCPGDASVCAQWFRDYTEPQVCSHACNLITGTGCPTGTKCGVFVITTPSTQFLTDCSADSGYGTAGGYCTVEEDCGPGTFCAPEITTCIAYCTYPSGPECSTGELCNQFVDPITSLPTMVTFDGVSYGYCN